MRTAALLPTPGDPLHIDYWIRHYDRVWRGEVDTLRVLVNGQPLDDARAYIARAVERVGGTYSEWTGPGRISHGDALNILVGDCEEDVLVLCEDDAFVRESGQISKWLGVVTRCERDVVASPRGSMSPELEQAAIERWGPRRAEDGSCGHGMWPAFIFAHRSTLLDTSRHFGERSWGRGQVVPGLGHRVEGEAAVADTFGCAAFELRERRRVLDIPQFKGPWRWREWLETGMLMPWFHTGSLSSSGNLVLGVAELAEGRRLEDEQELDEWAHRIHWWTRFLRCADGEARLRWGDRYAQNLGRLKGVMGVEDWRVDRWSEVTDRLVTWDERP